MINHGGSRPGSIGGFFLALAVVGFFASTFAHAQTQDYLIASGTVAVDDSSAQLDPFRVVQRTVGTADTVGAGTYSLTLRDSVGAILFQRLFEAQQPPESIAPTTLDFFEVMPYPAGTASIDLEHDSTPLTSVAVSTNIPVVNVSFPNGGEILSGQQTVTWSASDADGDPMIFDVLYSADGGANWSAIATSVTAASHLWDTDEVAGGTQSLVRVLASDGANTGQDDADAVFEVQSKVPEPMIVVPADQAVFFLHDLLLMEGDALDAEDGALSGTALTWTSSLDGVIGSGTDVNTTSLSAGVHLITLQADDSDANVATTSITITVSGDEDADGDGVGTGTDNCPELYNPSQDDLDTNGVGDACDDADADGYADNADNCPATQNNQADAETDGIGDLCDNCTLVSNNAQTDSDGDMFGNACDADFNNDGVVNGLDVGTYISQFGTTGPDADFNEDGVVNGLDTGAFVDMFGQAPGPSGLVP